MLRVGLWLIGSVFSTLCAYAQSDVYTYKEAGERVPLMLNLKTRDTLMIPVRVEGQGKVDTKIQVFPGRDENSIRRVRFLEPANLAGKDYWIYPRWLAYGEKQENLNPEDVKKQVEAAVAPARSAECPPPTQPPRPEIPAPRAAPTGDLTQGMNKVLNVFYRTCKASDLVLKEKYSKQTGNVNAHKTADGSRVMRTIVGTDRAFEEYRSKHPVLSRLEEIRENPKTPQAEKDCLSEVLTEKGNIPIYGWGAKANMWSEGKISVIHDQGPIGRSGVGTNRKYSSIDCSGIIAASMAAMGFRFTTDQRGFHDNLLVGTNTIDDLTPPRAPNSCFESPRFEKGSDLKAGDVINVPGLHVILVDEVGPNPFNVDDVRDRRDC